jgi:arylsulfatase A-like enzyme
MPFIVRWKGHTPAGKIDNSTIVSSADWLASVCKLTSVKLPQNIIMDGQDMSDAFLGKPLQRTKPLMWERRLPHGGYIANLSPMLAIRHGKWKLLMNPDKSRVELYDILNDPSELNNLASQYPKEVERLAETVLKWQKTLPTGPVSPDAGTNKYPWPGE